MAQRRTHLPATARGEKRGTPPRCIAIKLPSSLSGYRSHPLGNQLPGLSNKVTTSASQHQPGRPIRASLAESLQLLLVCGRPLDLFGLAHGWSSVGGLGGLEGRLGIGSQIDKKACPPSRCHLLSLVVVGSVGGGSEDGKTARRLRMSGPQTQDPELSSSWRMFSWHRLCVGPGPFRWALVISRSTFSSSCCMQVLPWFSLAGSPQDRRINLPGRSFLVAIGECDNERMR